MSNQKIFEVTKIKKWGQKEDEILITKTKNRKRKNWVKILPLLKGKTISDCVARYKNICFNHGKWSKEEDETLLKFHSLLGDNWAVISNLMKVRNWKQIRDRYLNNLNPKVIQDTFSEKEDLKIFELYPSLGTKWSSYLPNFPDRTADQIKNRFNSTIKRKITFSKISIDDRTSSQDQL